MNRAQFGRAGGILSFLSFVIAAAFEALVINGTQIKDWPEAALAIFFFILAFILQRLGV